MEIIAKSIFLAGVNAVKPKNLFNNLINRKIRSDGNEYLTISCSNNIPQHSLEIDITHKQCHLVGFGKAVLGMGVQIENTLSNKLVSGILSVPIGIQDRFKQDIDMQFVRGSIVEIYEGAENNLPDKPAEDTAKRIRKLVKNLKPNDILFVVISGGGSALLPLPTGPMSLNEKLNVIRHLTKNGASIDELNTVRIAMSDLKGGKLAGLGKNAHKIISFIISDIVDDPLELIASGPTITNNIDSDRAYEILIKYNLWNNLSKAVKHVILTNQNQPQIEINNSEIFLIGSNKIALKAAAEEAQNLKVNPIVLSYSVQGDVTSITQAYIQLTLAIKQLLNKSVDHNTFKSKVEPLKISLFFDDDFINVLLDKIESNNSYPICLLAGGEPTVQVKGTGIGGRNQELALRYAYEASKFESLRDIIFLSAGTDGIDGPTTAAGAIGCPQAIFELNSDNSLLKSLENSDSFSFWLLRRLLYCLICHFCQT